MTSFRILPTLALATLAILPLGTIGCSQGSHSPTEPEPLTEASTLSSSSSASSPSAVTAESHGADDTGADDNGGRNGNSGNPKAPKNPKAPRVGQEFAGAVRSVGAGSLTLANGVRITVNAQTQWVARGDLFSLSQVSASLAAHRAPRVEGRGSRQSDGSIAAASIKAEDNR